MNSLNYGLRLAYLTSASSSWEYCCVFHGTAGFRERDAATWVDRVCIAGQLAGTVIAALGLGELNKFLEPSVGAVVAKISILVLIVLFIQKRPQGLFALKGRSVD